MLESSRSQTEVSRILNVDQSVISRLWQRFQRTGDITRQPQYQVDQESQPLAKTDIWRVMVWAGIMMDCRTDLHFFDTGSVTTQRYRDEVFEPYVHLFRGAVGPDFIFMNDNAPCHQEVLMDDLLETEDIQRMSWPANSPDLNPNEHVWDILGRQIAAFSHPPNSIKELKRALQEAWNLLSPQVIHHLIATEAHGMLSNTYSETAISERTCREWFQCFMNCDFEGEDQHGGGREKVFEDAELEALLDRDSCQMQQELSGSLGVTQQTI
ncbi:transposable element Tcb2 transposase [Trichonephila clavipes]|nr:transposable element Tcb2 transposase [Trichonephila clavipes]